MLYLKNKSPILQYLLTIALAILGAMLVKALIAWTAEVFLHPIPVLGGWLKSLEIVELSNVVVFAILGFSLGIATVHLPPRLPLWQKSLALAIAIPLVFFTSYWVRQTLWLYQVASSSEVSYQQATSVANQALKTVSGKEGFWGYFSATTQMPILPTTLADIQRLSDDQKWFRSELTRFSGLQPGLFSLVFSGAGWGLRVFQLLLATLTGIIYFIKGITWADAERLRRLAAGKP
ncbi:MAG TPA: hypothetical protein V6D29_20070 [Leptolyngbyaceae cyanobacterium]